ncbi:MAG: hypothetical protein ACOX4X_04785 [Aminobacterium colombiense]|uniref:hypothetical protein n=1 Tax=Aminobacterium colombiense TaxID=81468 RepID=UPI003D97FE9B
MNVNDTTKFLKAEESAQEILRQLELLLGETISYKNATQEIDKAREGLVNLTVQLEDLGKSTVELIKKTNEFGLEGIQEKIANIEKYVQSQGQLLIKFLEENKKLMEEKNKTVSIQIADLCQKFEQNSENQGIWMKELSKKLDELKNEVKADNKFLRNMLFVLAVLFGVSLVVLKMI